MSACSQAIGVFDSGLGGISVLKAIHQLLPAEQLIYVADSAHAPYGAKTTDYIQQRCQKVAEFLLTQQIKVLVVACNTATVHAVEFLRTYLPIPVVGIEPAVKPAARSTQSKVIGVLATQQTVQSARLQRLITEHAQGVQVILQACPGLVEHVEAGDFASNEAKQLLSAYLQPLLEAGADTVVLGCTHYPFLSDSIKQLSQGRLQIVETSIPVTHQLIRVLQQAERKCQQAIEGKVTFYTSKADAQHFHSMQFLWQQPLMPLVLPPSYL